MSLTGSVSYPKGDTKGNKLEPYHYITYSFTGQQKEYILGRNTKIRLS